MTDKAIDTIMTLDCMGLEDLREMFFDILEGHDEIRTATEIIRHALHCLTIDEIAERLEPEPEPQLDHGDVLIMNLTGEALIFIGEFEGTLVTVDHDGDMVICMRDEVSPTDFTIEIPHIGEALDLIAKGITD